MALHCCPERAGSHQAEILDEAITALLSTLELPTVLERTAALLRKHFGATRVSIVRYRPMTPGSEAEVVLVDDPSAPTPELGAHFPLAGSALGQIVASRKAVVIEGIEPRRHGLREESFVAPFGYRSMVCFPLICADEVLGALNVAHKPQRGMVRTCFAAADIIARMVAVALHNSILVDEIRRLNALLNRENQALKEQIRQARKQPRYVAESPLMQEVLNKVRLVAASDTTVLIRGETGTGKEGLARLVHEYSQRFDRPYVVANLAAIPDTLIESELFGHEKGAFTGAIRRKMGFFEQAEGGTIFLDEVGDAPPAVQVRLLRVLQEREIQRVGGTEPVRVNVRVIAATNRALEAMVEQGSFRSDLYYRLNIFPVYVPPLRERPEDIRPLGEHLLLHHAQRMHRKRPGVDEAVWNALRAYPWPGNVRELENFLQRALILSGEDRLVIPALPGDGSPFATRRQPQPARAFDESVRTLLTEALERCQGRIYGPSGAAAMLGLKPTTLQGKLRKYRIGRQDPAASSTSFEPGSGDT